jgi:hypothetical protein
MGSTTIIRIENEKIGQLLQELSDQDRRSRVQEILWLIEQEAVRRGFKPVSVEQPAEDCIEA